MIEAKQTTEQILLSHLQALGTSNLDALMEDYMEESTFITPSGIFSGLAEIRAEFSRLLAAFPPGSTFNILQQTITDEYIYLIWSGESAYIHIPFAADTFVIRNNKILLQTFAGQINPKHT